MAARYAVNTAKALETILWISNARPDFDIYHIVKAAYFADKAHVRKFGRPIFGENYQADTYGPLGSTVYGLLNGSPLEILALGGNGKLPFTVGERWIVSAERGANLRLLSDTDVSALSDAVDFVAPLSFGELVDITHNDPAWRNANGGRMMYEDMFDAADPELLDRVEDLQASAPYTAFQVKLAPGHVIRLFDHETRPEKIKRHICVCPERRLFLRINSFPMWRPHFLMTVDCCYGVIEHDSYVELRNWYRSPPSSFRQAMMRSDNPLGSLPFNVAHNLALAARAAGTLTEEQKDLIWEKLSDL